MGGGCKSCLIEGGRQFSTGRCCQSKGKASTLNNLEGSIRGLEKKGRNFKYRTTGEITVRKRETPMPQLIL